MTTNSFGLLPDEDDFPCCRACPAHCINEIVDRADEMRDEVGE